MRVLKMLACALGGLLLGEPAFAQDNFLADIPRKEVLIVENPQGKITNPTWFNIWVVNHGGNSNGLRRTSGWIRSGTSTPMPASMACGTIPWPVKSATCNGDLDGQMGVQLRDGVLRSDGVEFSSRRTWSPRSTAHGEGSQHGFGWTRLPGKHEHRDGG